MLGWKGQILAVVAYSLHQSTLIAGPRDCRPDLDT